jgi:hypothetical protein
MNWSENCGLFPGRKAIHANDRHQAGKYPDYSFASEERVLCPLEKTQEGLEHQKGDANANMSLCTTKRGNNPIYGIFWKYIPH